MYGKRGIFLPLALHTRLSAPKWLLAAIALVIVANLWTAFGTLSETPEYAMLGMPFPPALRIILSIVWAILLALLFLGLLLHHRIAFVWATPLLSLYGLANLGFQILFARSDYSRGLFPYQLLITLLLLIPVWWVALCRGWLNPFVNRQT
jgi:hypothetical protein